MCRFLPGSPLALHILHPNQSGAASMAVALLFGLLRALGENPSFQKQWVELSPITIHETSASVARSCHYLVTTHRYWVIVGFTLGEATAQWSPNQTLSYSIVLFISRCPLNSISPPLLLPFLRIPPVAMAARVYLTLDRCEMRRRAAMEWLLAVLHVSLGLRFCCMVPWTKSPPPLLRTHY
ncbi:uncharacterized protein BO95DRAFT_115264 [Aspergillus brunneoviolaceus CBS 621.78]|uniref:Uncharacterized protein n=1 Tax=Aspergillus brunneoviolaceus CBS 621.78 TaxID=1450534 RepID=A0ACD1GN95_9EURO|nr:hypothetical protein BO95DRAFT_115264 [Aspergillus brunneoviolaceus CBS 621.78]RAH50834.1 hypothetical protein BO95DRAFT_115264 [Aspergillus brunneoviolaceus CBS 621.78]